MIRRSSAPRLSLYMFFLTLSLAAVFVLGTSQYLSRNKITTSNRAAETSGRYIKIVDATRSDSIGQRVSYAYAPTILKQNGVYHAFFCSSGSNIAGGDAWDYIRYVHSVDGVNWSQPVIKLLATAHDGEDVAACDPSVVYYQGMYYMFYTGGNTQERGGGGVQIARSTAVDGDYFTYTQRNTWERTPRDPKIIVRAQHPELHGYGAGQQSVVVYNDGLRMWYTDTSLGGSGGPVLMLDSTSPTAWDITQAREINKRSAHTNDVKYDPINNRFVMVRLAGQGSRYGYVEIGQSTNGLTWTFYTVIPSTEFVDFSGNSGFSGDREGHIIPNEDALFAFAAPYGLRDFDVRGEWDLYGMFINLNNYLVPHEPIGYNNTPNCEVVAGWTCDPDKYTQPLQVHIYQNGPYGQGTFLTAVVADQPREAGVSNACGGKPVHGFSFTIPNTLKDGQTHTLYTHAIGIDQTGAPDNHNPVLGNSPVMFRCGYSPSPTPTVVSSPTPTPTVTPVPSPTGYQVQVSCGSFNSTANSFHAYITWSPNITARRILIQKVDQENVHYLDSANDFSPVYVTTDVPNATSIFGQVLISNVFYRSPSIACTNHVPPK